MSDPVLAAPRAGRPRIGTARHVVLPDEMWAELETRVAHGSPSSVAEAVRMILAGQMPPLGGAGAFAPVPQAQRAACASVTVHRLTPENIAALRAMWERAGAPRLWTIGVTMIIAPMSAAELEAMVWAEREYLAPRGGTGRALWAVTRKLKRYLSDPASEPLVSEA